MESRDSFPEDLTKALVASYGRHSRTCNLGNEIIPSRDAIAAVVEDLLELLFPGFHRRQNLNSGNIRYHVGDLLGDLHVRLAEQISRVGQPGRTPSEAKGRSMEQARGLLERLPALREVLEADVLAAYEGDPAAHSCQEVVFCYPGLHAVAVFRLAHELLLLGVPVIPRMMTELAHGQTGIDLHPGARIGPGFFIDHGTGVVVGGTCVIGNRVKLYQGVTLGALSFPRDSDGNIIRGRKRHPTLEDDVVVYANATILGGDTVVGHHSVIGSSVWLTQSVAPHSIVMMDKPSLRIRGASKGESDDFSGFYQI